MPSIRQPSFAGGELADTLWGAIGLPKYSVGLRRMRNFFPTAHGVAMNRPGTLLGVDRAGKDHSLAVRTIPFIYSELANQAYALELGAGYVRFVVNGGYVAPDPAQYVAYAAGTAYAAGDWVTFGGVAYRSLQAGNMGHQPDVSPTWWEASSIYEIPSPWAAADLSRIQYAQQGDVVMLTLHGYAPRSLKRYAHAKWTLAVEVFNAPASTMTSRGIFSLTTSQRDIAPAVGSAGACELEYDIDKGLTFPTAIRHYAISRAYRDAKGLYWETLAHHFAGNARVKDPTLSAWGFFTPYEIGQMVKGSDGAAYYCIVANTAHDPVAGDYIDMGGGNFAYYWTPVVVGSVGGIDVGHLNGYGVELSLTEHRPKLTWNLPPLAAGLTPVSIRIYRGQEPAFGLLVELNGGAGAGSWTDDGTMGPDFAQSPRTGENPFASNWPACITYFERRRVLADLATGAGATPFQPATVRASATEGWTNFDEPFMPVANNSVVFELASRLREEIRWLLGHGRRLLVGTNSGIWATGGAGDSPLSPLSIDAKVQREDGSSWLPPVVAGDEVLYVTARGNAVQELFFEQSREKFIGSRLSILSDHLFRGRKIVDWCYAKEPWSIVWAVRDDGKLLSLTYLRELDVWGWAWHDLGGDGAAESVCAIPEGDEDAVYLVVRRTVAGQTKRYIERLSSRRVDDARLGVFLDSTLTLDGRNTGATAVTVSEIAAGGYKPEAAVAIASSADLFVAGDVGNEIVLDPDALPREDADGNELPPLGPVRLVITGYTGPRDVTAEVLSPEVPAALQAVATTAWARAVDELSGLDHLEGMTVVALADGNVVRLGADEQPLVVTGGAVTLPQPAAIIHVGLPYLSELELLDLAGSADVRAREKVVKKVIAELAASRGLRVGKDLENLSVWRPNNQVEAVGNGPVKLLTGRAEVVVSGEWAKHGRAAVQQADPLPCSIVAATRDVEIGGSS